MKKMGHSFAQDPTSRYARRLGVRAVAIRRLGGRDRLRAMHPWARKILLRSMFSFIEKRRKV